MADLEKHLPYALRQFESDILVPLQIFGIDVSFTSASAAKVSTVLLLSVYLIYAMRDRAVIPGRIQASAELIYSFVMDTVTRIAGPEGRASVPFIFTVCIFILIGTLLGMTPIHETFTSHLVVRDHGTGLYIVRSRCRHSRCFLCFSRGRHVSTFLPHLPSARFMLPVPLATHIPAASVL